ncbi:hypothetical protein OC835_005370 [Tilletia horrida]|nr:hypothetical protein OC835_005370 [Tilletia horrida]
MTAPTADGSAETTTTTTTTTQLVPLRVHRLQHVHPPAHHVFTTPAASASASSSSATGGGGIGAFLPHWNAVPERFFHPRHRRHKRKQAADAAASQDVDADEQQQQQQTQLLRIGFQNPWPSFHRPSFWEIWHSFRWGVPPPHFDADMGDEIHTSHRERKKLRKRAQTDPELHLTIETPDFSYTPGTVKATWVGHAGTLLTLPPVNGRTDPFRILFDPIFSARCSPLRGAGPLRAYEPPCTVDDLPPIDLVIISHNHYDHLDYDTISDLWAANENRGIRFIAPLGNKSWFVQEGLGIDPERVVDLDWWDELVLGGSPVLPAADAPAAKEEDVGEHKDEEAEPKLHAEVHVPVKGASDAETSFTNAETATLDRETGTAAGSAPVTPLPKSDPVAAAAALQSEGKQNEDDDLTESIREQLSARERDALQEPLLPFVRVICTPAQHQSGRYAVDACSALWSSWVVEYHHADEHEPASSDAGQRPRRCFRTFFGGDTGYRFHDTVAAAAREAEAKQKQQEIERKGSSSSSSDSSGSSVLRKMSTKLSNALSSGSADGEGSSKAKKDSEKEKKQKKDKTEEDPFPACPAFTHIASEIGPPNLLLLPISVGATISFLKSYDPLPPRWSPFPRVDERLTSAVHMGPEDAVRVLQLMTTEAVEAAKAGDEGKESQDADAAEAAEESRRAQHGPPLSSHLRRFAHLGASPHAPSALQNGATALAIHWGTFVGGKDEVHQSIRALRRACGKEGVRFAREHREEDGAEGDGKNTFALVNHGESVVLRL